MNIIIVISIQLLRRHRVDLGQDAENSFKTYAFQDGRYGEDSRRRDFVGIVLNRLQQLTSAGVQAGLNAAETLGVSGPQNNDLHHAKQVMGIKETE